jgi:hypothetical protein
MIDIDYENEKIFFFHPLDLVKKAPSKYDEEMHEFDLLSGYKCPECNQVLSAYYIGSLKIEDSSGTYHSHPYIPNLYGYSANNPRHQYGHKYGGGYLIMSNHNDTYCKNHIASVGGITEGIKQFISYIIPTSEIVPSEYMIKKFAADIFENKIPGVFLIHDVCNKLLPILAINKKEFVKHINYNNYSEFDKEYKWNTLFYKLIIGDPNVQITQIYENNNINE